MSVTKKELKTIYGLSSNKKRPPKVAKKSPYVRRLFTTRPTTLLLNPAVGLSPLYNEALNASYFDQVFDTVAALGEGSFGEVYKVRSREDGRLYAVKRTKEPYRSAADRQHKVAEVRKHERVPPHPNCIALVNAWEQDDRVYLQMELGGQSLAAYADRNAHIAEPRLWSVLLDVLLALQNLHDSQLVHLDVKLENIMVCGGGACKLADFGLTQDLRGDDLRQAREGDAKYLAPELLAADGQCGKPADVFSLGVCMLELASDMALPSNGPLWHELRDGSFPAHAARRVPRQLLACIRRMMARDAGRRPTVAALLRHPRLRALHRQRLAGSLEGALTPPRADSPPPQPAEARLTPPLGYSSPPPPRPVTRLDLTPPPPPPATPGPLTVAWSPRLHTPLHTSAKKLHFLDD